jgi:hypothetical protein
MEIGMRGRKSDAEFISEFIAECIRSGRDTPGEIIQQARQDINHIDDEIRRVESLKQKRAKLLDVISTFEKSVKPSKSEEARVLSFFKIQQPRICKFICDRMKTNVISVDDLTKLKYPASDVLFCIKQLLEQRIISKSGVHLLRGEMFDDYLKFVLREG